MLLQDIHIQNFRLFKSLRLENLPQFTLIGGKNNSGKTSLLEAVFLLLGCQTPDVFFKLLNFRGLNVFQAKSLFATLYHNLDINKNMKFEYKLKNKQKKIEYKIMPNVHQPLNIIKDDIIELKKDLPDPNAFHKMEIRYKIGSNSHKVFLESDSKGEYYLKGEAQNFKTYDEGIKGYFLPAAMSLDFTGKNVKLYSNLDKENKTSEIMEALRMLEPKLKSLNVIAEGATPVLYADTDFGKKLPLALTGEGMKRLLLIILLISDTKNGIVLLDEIENGFHHSVMSDVWQTITAYAQKCQTQIIAVTHSREFVQKAVEGIEKPIQNLKQNSSSAANPNLKDNFKYIRIDREGDKFTPVYYNFEILKTALDKNFEIR